MQELYHHGILGQKWGVRRYQNKDGTLTAVGKKRYRDRFGEFNVKVAEKRVNSLQKDIDSFDAYRGKGISDKKENRH